MNFFTREPTPTCEEELEKLRTRIRELEFTIAQNPAKLNLERQVLTISGLDYSLALFEQLGSFLPIGAYFQLMDRAGGSITIRHICTELDARRALKETIEREAKRAADFEKTLRNPGDFHE